MTLSRRDGLVLSPIGRLPEVNERGNGRQMQCHVARRELAGFYSETACEDTKSTQTVPRTLP